MFIKSVLLCLAISQLLMLIGVSAQNSCNPRKVAANSSRILCVCDSSTCEDLNFEYPSKKNELYLVTSSKSGKRFETTNITEKDAVELDGLEATTSIRVDLLEQHQEILGFGGAFTDAAAMNILSLPVKLSDKLIASYYGPKGLQYNFGRVPLGGSDFSIRSYSYDDSNKTDFDLNDWSLSNEDIKYRIPVIKKAAEFVKQTGTYLKLFSSPWSAPGWMKTTGSLVGGSLIDKDEIYKSYANYWIKFYDSFQKYGVKFWGATVQNEPMTAKLYGPKYNFNNMPYTSEQFIKFITEYLGPALEKNGMTKDKFKLMVGDDNLGYIDKQAIELMTDPEVLKYVSSFAFHWYTVTSGEVSYENLTRVYDIIKNQTEFMIMTEACEGFMEPKRGVDLGSWERAETYAADIIQDINRHTGAWVDWNLALDLEGGPNWVSNFVDSPILVDRTSGEFYKQPMYYALAHFSRLFRPGTIKLETITTVGTLSAGIKSDILATSVHNKQTGHLIINILNRGKVDRKVKISLRGSKKPHSLEEKIVVLEANSVNSIVSKL